jgi:prenyltransferase beta subunit
MLLLLEYWSTGGWVSQTSVIQVMLIDQQMLGQVDLIDKARMRYYLLEKTQHIVGGFGKGVGEPPGIVPYHIHVSEAHCRSQQISCTPILVSPRWLL